MVEIPRASVLAARRLTPRLIEEAFVAQRGQAIVVVVPVSPAAPAASLAALHAVIERWNP
jgi:hypothetical protein